MAPTAMRLTNSNHYARKLFRARATLAVLACALLAALLAASGSHAQQPSNSNAAQQPKRAKRITPLRASDSAQGSRVTITSDGELSDYSAYRSGDRFIVVIPQAQGGGGEGARGRGFEGAQVTKRGNDLVYTFKLQPGASAKVSQKFNRLDVQFTAGKGSETTTGAQAAPTPAPTPRAPAEIAGIKPTPAASATPARENPSSAINQAQLAPSPSVAANAGGANVSPSFPSVGTTPAATPSVAPSAAPSVAATPVQLAQAQATPAAPVQIVAPSATGATTSTLGAFVQHNWHWFIGALLVVGVGLLLVTRLGERQAAPAPQAKAPELRDAKTSDVQATPARPQPVAKPAEVTPAKPVEVATATERVAETKSVAPLAAAAGGVAAQTKKQDRKKKRGKKGRAVEEPAAKAEASRPAAVAAETAPAAESLAPTRAGDAADVAGEVAGAAAPVAGAALVETGREEVKAVEIADAPAADTERVGEEIGKLFAGAAYDESVVGARDRATREMVSSELLAGLSSRNAERNERARAAFLKHGYFEDATRDLQSAEAPAQRASAAHALSLLRDRTTTPHLVAALEDPSSDVRRASVEALAELKDPAALGPLEALRWRETSRQVPRALILRAVEACTPTAEEAEAAPAPAVEPVAPEAAATEFAQSAEAVAEPEAVAAPEVETHEASMPQGATLEAETAETDTAAVADAVEATPDGAALDDVTVEAAATPAAPVEDEGEFEMIAGVEIPRARTGGAGTVDEAAPEFEERAALEAPASGPAGEAALDQFVAHDEVVAAQAAAESRAFDGHEGGATADAVETAAVESRAFVEPQIEEVDAAGDVVAAPAQAFEEMASAEPLMTEAGRSAATDATVETVYTYEESAHAEWPARREDEGAPDEGRAAVSLDERAPARSESFARASEEAEEETAEHAPVYAAPEFAVASGERVADDWLDIDVDEQPVADSAPSRLAAEPGAEFETHAAPPAPVFEATAEQAGAAPSQLSAEAFEHAGVAHAPEVEPPTPPARGFAREAGEESGTGVTLAQKGIELSGIEPEDVSIIPKSIQLRLGSEDAAERAASVRALARLDTDEAFHQICAAFDDPAQEVRDAAARALYDSAEDRAESFTRALRDSHPERRRQIGAALASSGLAEEAVSQLTGESRGKTYDAFSLLFLMAKAGETAPLIRAVESHPESEVRLAVVKLLALSGQQEVLPSFK
ncbi:MAG TPA: HEAT repeat domain-containing protein, partial [Pyrinomonadaceae bacterium]